MTRPGDLTPETRLFEALDRVTTTLEEAGGMEGLLTAALVSLMALAPFDVGIARLAEGDRLVVKASVGLQGAVDESISTARSSAEAFVQPVSEDAEAWTEVVRAAGVKSLFSVALAHGNKVVGVLYLGALAARALEADEVGRLNAFAKLLSGLAGRQAAHDALSEAVESRDALMSIVAHDLRNPISVISMSANMMFDQLQDAASRRLVERIVRAAQRAEFLIRDLLEVQSIESGRFKIEPRKIDPARAILLAIDSQFSLAAAAAVVLKSDISPEIPAIQGDHERLAELLENLIGNALKFTGANGIVTIGARLHGDEVRFWVNDNGPGIPKEQVAHLFDRFFQARKRDRRGLGLGLTICKAIAEAHGGRIWVESEVGVGTTVFFSIPAASSATRPIPRRPANILLVDDRPENLMSLQAVLECPDYRLVTADSGHKALSLALREDFVLALVDIAMPGMDGLQVASHLKQLKRSRDVPIIFVTAFGDDPKEVHRAYAAGGVDYIVKPFDAEIVRKKVAVFVELSRRQPQIFPDHS